MAFQETLQVGKVSESKIACWFRHRYQYCVLPIYEIAEGQYKGPQFFTPDKELVAPDMLVVSPTLQTKWVEAKHKSVFSWHRITQKWTTGVDLRHYSDYGEIACISPFPVWLLFYHTQSETSEGDGRSPVGLYGNDIIRLAETENHRSSLWGKSGMVYWAVESLILLATCEEVEEAYKQRVA